MGPEERKNFESFGEENDDENLSEEADEVRTNQGKSPGDDDRISVLTTFRKYDAHCTPT